MIFSISDKLAACRYKNRMLTTLLLTCLASFYYGRKRRKDG
jgi:hypothetical protein